MIGWLVRVVLVIGIVGLVLMDGIAVGSARMNVDQDAHDAANAVRDANVRGTSYQQLVGVAEASLLKSSPDDVLVKDSLVIAADGTVTLKVERTATTLVLGKIKPLAKYAQTTATASSTEQHGANQGGLAGLLAQALVEQIVHSVADTTYDIAGMADNRLLHAGQPHGLLYGPRSPLYGTDSGQAK